MVVSLITSCRHHLKRRRIWPFIIMKTHLHQLDSVIEPVTLVTNPHRRNQTHNRLDMIQKEAAEIFNFQVIRSAELTLQLLTYRIQEKYCIMTYHCKLPLHSLCYCNINHINIYQSIIISNSRQHFKISINFRNILTSLHLWSLTIETHHIQKVWIHLQTKVCYPQSFFKTVKHRLLNQPPKLLSLGTKTNLQKWTSKLFKLQKHVSSSSQMNCEFKWQKLIVVNRKINSGRKPKI